MSNLVLPRVQAMVLCDDVVESDEELGVFHLTGVRTTVEAPSFPTVHSLRVFVQMSGHQGEASCHVVIERAESNEVIDETEPQTMFFVKPTLIVSPLFDFPNCAFPAPGVYYVQVYNEGKLIAERRLTFRIEE